jgi:hypothetical protein
MDQLGLASRSWMVPASMSPLGGLDILSQADESPPVTQICDTRLVPAHADVDGTIDHVVPVTFGAPSKVVDGHPNLPPIGQ